MSHEKKCKVSKELTAADEKRAMTKKTGESAPSFQSLFITPRAVQSIKVTNRLTGFVMALGDPERLKTLVQMLGFGHLHLDVSVLRVLIFRDAFMTSSPWNLPSGSSQRRPGRGKRFFNYLGGALLTSM